MKISDKRKGNQSNRKNVFSVNFGTVWSGVIKGVKSIWISTRHGIQSLDRENEAWLHADMKDPEYIEMYQELDVELVIHGEIEQF